jgi:CheY-like chemotaxis protein
VESAADEVGDTDPRTADGERPATSTILLVDDDRDFRATLADVLSDEGYSVIEASSGQAALAALDDLTRSRKPGPDVLVLDLMMPGMSGIEVLQRLQKTPQWARLPVVVLTGMNDPMLSVRLDLPIAFKPDMDALLTAVQRQITTGPSPAGHS